MIGDRHSENDGPLTWVGKLPIYSSTVLAAIHAGSLVFTAIAMASGAESLLQQLIYSSQGVLKNLYLWQAATYAFIHFPPYWFFLVELYLLAVFGRELERHFGRGGFLKLYFALLFLPPLLLTIAGAIGIPSTYAGSGALHLGMFVAFAVAYPTVELLFSLQARWVALGLFAISALQCLAFSDFSSLSVLVIDCAAAYAIVKTLQGNFQLPQMAPKKIMKEKVQHSPTMSNRELHKSIDPILDKISRSGMASLTARERQQLEKARAALEAQQKSR